MTENGSCYNTLNSVFDFVEPNRKKLIMKIGNKIICRAIANHCTGLDTSQGSPKLKNGVNHHKIIITFNMFAAVKRI